MTGLLKNTTYFWRASAVDLGGNGPFSSPWSFTTFLPPPVLRAPVNGAQAQPISIVFSWAPAEGAVRYRFQLSLDSLFSTFVKNDTTETDTTRTVIGLTGATVYFWRVQGITNSGVTAFTDTWKFRTIGALPGTATLLNPVAGAQIPPDPVVFTWRRTSPTSTAIGLKSPSTRSLR